MDKARRQDQFLKHLFNLTEFKELILEGYIKDGIEALQQQMLRSKFEDETLYKSQEDQLRARLHLDAWMQQVANKEAHLNLLKQGT